MRSETQQDGRRSRGGRRRNNNGEDRRGPSQSSSRSQGSVPASAPKKLGFFGRIVAFFTGDKGKKQGTSTNGSAGRNGNGRTSEDKGTPGVITIPKRKISFENGAAPQAQAPVQANPKAARKPELVDVTSPKLYVGNLSFDATESDLSELFAGVGSVQAAEVVSHRETHKSKGFAFVTLGSVEEAKRAVVELHDKEFMGRHLVVSGAKTNDVR